MDCEISCCNVHICWDVFLYCFLSFICPVFSSIFYFMFSQAFVCVFRFLLAEDTHLFLSLSVSSAFSLSLYIYVFPFHYVFNAKFPHLAHNSNDPCSVTICKYINTNINAALEINFTSCFLRLYHRAYVAGTNLVILFSLTLPSMIASQ